MTSNSTRESDTKRALRALQASSNELIYELILYQFLTDVAEPINQMHNGCRIG